MARSRKIGKYLMPKSKTKKKQSENVERSISQIEINMLAECGMPTKYREKVVTFDNFKVGKDNIAAFHHAMNFVYGTGRGILFYGPSGVGKTHLACAIIHKLICEQRIFAKFQKVARIPRNDQDAILELIDPDMVPVLVLDDLGTEKLTDRALECLYVIIDGRNEMEAPMIVTTNFDLEDLRVRFGEYGDRIVGRLREACRVVAIGGTDYREKL